MGDPKRHCWSLWMTCHTPAVSFCFWIPFDAGAGQQTGLAVEYLEYLSTEYVQTAPYNKGYTESQLQAGGGFVLLDFNEEQVTPTDLVLCPLVWTSSSRLAKLSVLYRGFSPDTKGRRELLVELPPPVWCLLPVQGGLPEPADRWPALPHQEVPAVRGQRRALRLAHLGARLLQGQQAAELQELPAAGWCGPRRTDRGMVRTGWLVGDGVVHHFIRSLTFQMTHVTNVEYTVDV